MRISPSPYWTFSWNSFYLMKEDHSAQTQTTQWFQPSWCQQSLPASSKLSSLAEGEIQNSG
eukprot:10239.XXX_456607_456789_1 [CDS] Oithona nana genome sequencing.